MIVRRSEAILKLNAVLTMTRAAIDDVELQCSATVRREINERWEKKRVNCKCIVSQQLKKKEERRDAKRTEQIVWDYADKLF
jgi:hypothetical protein